MKIFILEDSEERISWFNQVLGLLIDLELVVCRTVEAALYSFEGLQPDWIFLDHDLDTVHAQGAYHEPSMSGLAFVKSVLADEIRFPGLRLATKVVVHSVNPDGALAMCGALTAANVEWERIPFPSLQQRMSVS